MDWCNFWVHVFEVSSYRWHTIFQAINGRGSSYVCLHTNLWCGSVYYNKIGRVSSYTKSQQIDLKHLSFAHSIIADITSELKNYTFAEIAPRTFYPLYGIQLLSDTYAVRKLCQILILLKLLRNCNKILAIFLSFIGKKRGWSNDVLEIVNMIEERAEKWYNEMEKKKVNAWAWTGE